MTRPADRIRIALSRPRMDDAAPGSLANLVPVREPKVVLDASATISTAAHRMPRADDRPTNILVFPTRQTSASSTAPALDVASRPAPDVAPAGRLRWPIVFAITSLLAHGLVMLTFLIERESEAASIGREVISVELVLGAETTAGIAQRASASEAVPSASKADDSQTKQDQALETPSESKTHEAMPPRQIEAPPATAAIPEPLRSDRPAEITPPSEPQPAAADPAPRRQKPMRDVAARMDEGKHARGPSRQRERSHPSQPSASSNGIGRGSSRSVANYRGAVAAHLARHKRNPSVTREGTATIAFTIAGSGTVSSVRLVRSAGASALDQEAQAMPRRASPFPAPPDGRSMNFTVPIRFSVR